MATKYRSGHRLDLWISERAWADLQLLPQATQRARVEAALAQAVLGPKPVVETSAAPAVMEYDVQGVRRWMRHNRDEEDFKSTWEGLQKWAKRESWTLQRTIA